MKITAVLFDLDGTLLNTLEDLKNSVNFAMSTKGYPERTLDEVRRFIGNGIPKLIERAAPKNADEETLDALLAEFRGHYKSNCAKSTRPYPQINALIGELKERNLPLGVVSNKSHRETCTLVETFFPKTFSFVLGSREDLPRKPNPQGVNEAMSYFGATEDNIVYVGDSDIDIKTAKNAGIRSIGVSWGFRGRNLLEQEGADYIVDEPVEILGILEAIS